jgi:DNA-binding NarL/FixJ family response regulator
MGDVLPRIVIVDDDPAFLATVRLVLEGEGFTVVGEALNGLDGVAAAAELGFEVAERLARMDGSPPVVLTSIHAAQDFGNLVERSGARGFITKADVTGEALTRFLEGRAAPA